MKWIARTIDSVAFVSDPKSPAGNERERSCYDFLKQADTQSKPIVQRNFKTYPGSRPSQPSLVVDVSGRSQTKVGNVDAVEAGSVGAGWAGRVDVALR